MHKAPAALAFAIALPVVVVLPVVTPTTAAPKAVALEVHHVGLADADGTRQSAAEVLTSPADTDEFSALGVSWDLPADGSGESDVLAFVRTRSLDDGTWSGWEELEARDGMPVGSDRVATEPVWTGESDGVQVRVDVRAGAVPTGLTADLVDPGDSRYDAQVGRTPADTATAEAGQPAIFSRAQWGADESRRGGVNAMSTVKAGVLHHTAATNDYGVEDVPKVIRALYAYDLNSGWSDIAYNVLVDRFGRAWEGRAGSVAGAAQSGATGGFNPYTYSVSVLGNYEKVAPDPAVIDTASRLFAWKLGQYHRDPLGFTTLVASNASGTTSRHRNGTNVTLPVIMGHRDTGNTACPGKYLYPFMSDIRARAAGYMQAAVTNPKLSAASVPFQGGGVTLTAGVLTDQSWTFAVTDPAGAPIESAAGSAARGTPVSATWDGHLPGGAWAPPATYTVTLRSQSAGGAAVPYTTRFVVGTPPPPPPPATGEPAAAPVRTGTFVPLAPARIVDTRSGRGRPIRGGTKLDIAVTGRQGVPSSGVDTVLLNVTATGATRATHLTAWPAGNALPRSSSLNLPAGVNRAALVAVGVGKDGKVSLRNNVGETDVAVDVVGYSVSAATVAAGSASGVSGAVVQAIPGTRIYDSRPVRSILRRGEIRRIPVPALAGVDPSAISAVMVNLTVTGGSGAGYLTAYAPGTRSAASSINFTKGETAANRVVVGVTGGAFQIRNSSPGTHVAVDVVGVYAAPALLPTGGNVTAVQPVRVLDTRQGTGGPLGVGGLRDVNVVGGATGVPTTATAVLATVTGVKPSVRSHLAVFPKDTAIPRSSDVNVAVGDVRANLALIPVGTGGQITVVNNAGSQSAVIDVLGYVQ